MTKIGFLAVLGFVLVVGLQQIARTDPVNAPVKSPAKSELAPKPQPPPQPVLGNDQVSRMTLTWHVIIHNENCIDVFGRSCSATFPTPQCPSGTVSGGTCTAYGSGYKCYTTASPYITFSEYECE